MSNNNNDYAPPTSPYLNGLPTMGAPLPIDTGNPTSSTPQPITPSYDGLPTDFPMNSIFNGINNIQSLYNGVGQSAPGYYQSAQGGVNSATGQGLNQLQGSTNQAIDVNQGLTNQAINQQGQLGGQAQSQISGLENQNLGQVNNLLNNYDQSFIQSLGPQGQLGNQLSAEFNNYGITPQSGAFQSALGNQLGTLGAQNALTLGQQALQPGINAQYGDLSSTLGSQLGTSQSGNTAAQGLVSQGLGQAGTAINSGTIQNQQLGQQGALSPLNYENQALSQQTPLINEMTQAPIDFWNSQNNNAFASQIAQQNQDAQSAASNNALTGQLGSSALTSAALLAAK